MSKSWTPLWTSLIIAASVGALHFRATTRWNEFYLSLAETFVAIHVLLAWGWPTPIGKIVRQLLVFLYVIAFCILWIIPRVIFILFGGN
jgi:hypothetical protein